MKRFGDKVKEINEEAVQLIVSISDRTYRAGAKNQQLSLGDLCITYPEGMITELGNMALKTRIYRSMREYAGRVKP